MSSDSDAGTPSGPNAAQAAYWTATGGPNWVRQQQVFDTMLHHFSDRALEVFDPQPADLVLDVGCGFGTTTLALAIAIGPNGQVTGVDISPPMVDAATARAERELAHGHAARVCFRVADAQTANLTKDTSHFDGAFSRFGVMFFDDPVAAFANIARAIRHGGRLTFVCWQAEEHNEWIAGPAAVLRRFIPNPVPAAGDAPGPFAFRDADRVRRILADAGWHHVDLEPFAAPVVMGGDGGLDAALTHAMSTSTAQALRAQVDEATFERASAVVAEMLADHVVDGRVCFTGNVWVATATKP